MDGTDRKIITMAGKVLDLEPRQLSPAEKGAITRHANKAKLARASVFCCFPTDYQLDENPLTFHRSPLRPDAGGLNRETSSLSIGA